MNWPNDLTYFEGAQRSYSRESRGIFDGNKFVGTHDDQDGSPVVAPELTDEPPVLRAGHGQAIAAANRRLGYRAGIEDGVTAGLAAAGVLVLIARVLRRYRA